MHNLIGHLPFSHAGEKLFPDGWDHEKMSAKIIEEHYGPLLQERTPPLRWKDIVKVAIGRNKISKWWPNEPFSLGQELFSEIITSDTFGVDRIDYLLRDSYHLGVPFGNIDQKRLIDTVRILQLKDDAPTLGLKG